MIDVLYVAANRLEFTKATFTALIQNTNWSLVNHLYVYDDASSDGTAEWLNDSLHPARSGNLPHATIEHGPFGGPVAAMNHYLSSGDRADLLAKVDNDFVMPPGWLDTYASVMGRFPHLEILGSEPDFGGLDPSADPTLRPPKTYSYDPADFIGGKGIMRTAAWEGRPMKPGGQNGYFGFTEWQNYHHEVLKGWLLPGLCCFGLDQLPMEPWRSLTDEYVERGWQRRWPEYAPGAWRYWTWWTDRHCDHDWLPPHEVHPFGIWHKVCALCGYEVAA